MKSEESKSQQNIAKSNLKIDNSIVKKKDS